MDLNSLQSFLGWCIIINYAILLIWFAFLVTARDWLFGLHAGIFGVEKSVVQAEHFRLFGQFKLLIMIFNIAPWLALVILRS